MKELADRFGDRFCTEPSERRLCTHDVGNLPDIIGVGVMDVLVDRMPIAIVQPVSVEEVVAVVRYAVEHRVPLTPRAAASSGVGGAVPAKGGIVVDMMRMNRILSVDRSAMTATVQPGVVWNILQAELERQGLSLRIYPTSAPASAVAGWIGSGGIGIGSFEFGQIGENIVSLELVLPDGEVRRIGSEPGGDLDLVVDCQGISGIVTEVTLKVMALDPVVPAGLTFDTIADLHAALQEIAAKVPIWTGNLETKEFVALQHEAKGSGGEAHHTVILGIPRSRYRAEDVERVAASFNGRVHPHPEELWADRFMPMRIKKLGPSIVAGEVYLPLNRLQGFLERVYEEFEGDTYGIEATLGKGGDTAVRAYVLSDERDDFGLGFATRWGRALTFLAIAKRYGGRTYQTGLYLAKEAKAFFGEERLHRLRALKAKHDPHDIMNPGKIFAPRKFSIIWGIAAPFLGMSRGLDIGDSRAKEPKKEEALLIDFNDQVYSCIECGTCRETCPVYSEIRWLSSSPKGKMALTKDFVRLKTDVDDYMYKRFFQCTLCGKCKEVCQALIPVCDILEHMRLRMHEMGHDTMDAHKSLLASIAANGNPFAEPRGKRTELYPERKTGYLPPDAPGRVDVLIFAGCVNSYQDLGLLKSLMGILDAAGKTYTTLGENEGCCGYVTLLSGLPEFEGIARATAERLKARGAKVVVTPCAGCYKTISHHYPEHGIEHGLEVLHLVEYLERLIKEGSLKFEKPFDKTVAYHDPCDIGRHLGIYEPPRAVLRAIPGLKLVEFPTNRNMATCCGGGGALKMVDLELSKNIAYRRVLEAASVDAEVVVSGCPSCKGNLKLAADRARKEKTGKMRVMDLTEVVYQAIKG